MNHALPRTRKRTNFLLVLISFLIATLLTPWQTAQAAPAAQNPPGTRLIRIPSPAGVRNFGRILAYDGKTLVVLAEPLTPDQDNLAVQEEQEQGLAFIYRLDAGNPDAWQLEAEITFVARSGLTVMGENIAVEGDTIVIGTPGNSGPGTPSLGGVYFVERTEEDPTWRITQYENNDVAMGIGANFGAAIAINGRQVLIGAPGASVFIPESGATVCCRGAAYLYTRAPNAPGTWGKAGTFWDPRGSVNDGFGRSVAIDTYQDITAIVVGSPSADVEEVFDNRGRVLVWERLPGAGFTKLSDFIGPDTSSGYGWTVALHEFDIAISGSREVVLRDQEEGTSTRIVRIISPVEDNSFAQSLDLHKEVLVIGAPNEGYFDFYGWGAVYRVEKRANEWEIVAKYQIESTEGGGALGLAVAVHDGLIIAGAPGDDSVYIIDDRPRTPDEDSAYRIFLPAALNQQLGGIRFQPLLDGGSIQGPSGALIGAVEGTLEEPVDVFIAATAVPTNPVPAGLTVVGDYHSFGAVRPVRTSPDTPFLVGLPIPPGADPQRLAAALLLTEGESLDYDEEGEQWATTSGAYDAEAQLMVFVVSRLVPEATTAVLVSHPNFAPLPAPDSAASATPANETFTDFWLQCHWTTLRTDQACSPEVFTRIQSAMLAALDDFRSYGFLDPALNRHYPLFRPGLDLPHLERYQRFFEVLIQTGPCTTYLGVYHPSKLGIELCIDTATLGPNGALSEKMIDTIRHELFHAVQYSYPALRQDWNNINWLLEGTATAAMRSFATMRHDSRWPARAVDPPLDSNDIGRPNFYAYRTQDFWVYTGQALGEGLGYLRPIFESGGTPAKVDAALAGTLASAYWGWVKNQLLEKELPMQGRYQFGACRFEADLVNARAIQISENTSLPYQQTGALQTLTGTAYEITFLDEFPSVEVGVKRAGPATRYKIYKQNDNDCLQVADSESRTFEDITPGITLYVVVANPSYTQGETHQLEIRGAEEPQ